jgi:hypothetical protein
VYPGSGFMNEMKILLDSFLEELDLEIDFQHLIADQGMILIQFLIIQHLA